MSSELLILTATTTQEETEKTAKIKKYYLMKNRKKFKGDCNTMYMIAIGLVGKECKILTLLGTVSGKVVEVNETAVTLIHKQYKRIVSIEHIITIVEKITR